MGRTSDARNRLIEAARDLMYARGYGEVGVQEICDQAGVNKGSFYHFFSSKQELGSAVVGEYERYSTQLLDRALKPEFTPLERLQRWFALAHIGQCAGAEKDGHVKGCPVGTLALEVSTKDETLRGQLEGVLDRWIARFQALLDEAVERGDIQAQDTRAGARALVAYAEGVTLLAKVHNDPDTIKELVDGAFRLIGADPAGVGPHLTLTDS